jgi:uncharacterized protein DUF4383
VAAPARVYAGVAGAALALAGIAGFFYSADFGSPGDVERALGILDVNGWNNVLHILTGALALAAFGAGDQAARRCALALGAPYLVVAVGGFAAGDGGAILSIVPVDTAGNALHLLIGLAGLAAAGLRFSALGPKVEAP